MVRSETLVGTLRSGQFTGEINTFSNRGVSGQELTSRAYTQAQKFGADVQVASGGSRLI